MDKVLKILKEEREIYIEKIRLNGMNFDKIKLEEIEIRIEALNQLIKEFENEVKH